MNWSSIENLKYRTSLLIAEKIRYFHKNFRIFYSNHLTEKQQTEEEKQQNESLFFACWDKIFNDEDETNLKCLKNNMSHKTRTNYMCFFPILHFHVWEKSFLIKHKKMWKNMRKSLPLRKIYNLSVNNFFLTFSCNSCKLKLNPAKLGV